MPGFEEPPAAPARALWCPRDATLEVVVTPPLTPAAVADLCGRVRALIEAHGARLIVCDVGTVTHPDAGTIEALARAQLTARRLGAQVRLRAPCDRLRDLLAFVGMADVLPSSGSLWLDPRRQAEEREQACGVEEEADPSDPAG